MNITLIGVRPLRRELDAAHRKFNRELRKELRIAAREVQRSARRAFGPRHPRGTPRSGAELNIVSGDARRAIKVKRLVVRSGRDFSVQIGPKPGDAVPGFYLRFHELGLGGLRERSVIKPGLARVAEKIYARLSRLVDRLFLG